MGRLRLKSAVKGCLVLVALSAIAALGVHLRSTRSPNNMKRAALLTDVPHGHKVDLRASLQHSKVSATRIRDLTNISEKDDVIGQKIDNIRTLDAANQSAGHASDKLVNSTPRRGSIIIDKFKPKRSLQRLIRKFPMIMIIGFGKAGTKALFDVLKMHPDVHGPVSERRFFSDHYDKGLRYYLTSLPEPSPGGFVVEKSPDYIIDEPVPARITASAKRLGISVEELKFVVVLRDPVDRAMSEYLEWQVSRHNSGSTKLPPFHHMIWNQNGTINSEQPFLKYSNYAQFIKHWFQYFNRTQTCFVDGDKFIKDPFSEVHMLEACLHLKLYFTSGHFVYEPKRKFYCFKDSINQTEPYCMGSSKGRKHPPIPDKALSALRKHYRPFDNQLEALTGRTMQWLQHLE